MALSGKQKVGALVPTRTTGIYYRLKANGTKTFYCRYTRPDGKRAFEAAASFEAAKTRLAEVQGRIAKGDVVGDPTTTLEQVVEQWRATRTYVKPRTRAGEEAHVRLYFGPLLRLRVRDINRAKVLGWLAGLTRQDGKTGLLSDSTKAHVMATLSSVLDHAVLADIISVNPVKTLGRKQKPRQGKGDYRLSTAEELDAILAGVGRQQWMEHVIRFAVLTGLRLGEICALAWGDIDFDAGTITVARQLGQDGNIGTPKGGVAASMPMIRPVRVLLAELKLAAATVASDSPVFVNSRGEHRHPRQIQRAFAWAKERAGTEGRFRFHDLRHTCISLLANAPGAELPQVQAYARHAALATTLGYVHKVERAEWADQADTAFAGFGG
jgi:integrase